MKSSAAKVVALPLHPKPAGPAMKLIITIRRPACLTRWQVALGRR